MESIINTYPKIQFWLPNSSLFRYYETNLELQHTADEARKFHFHGLDPFTGHYGFRLHIQTTGNLMGSKMD